MSGPLVSIIVPVYNVDKYLNQCIDSIIGQTYENLEIILVDDGSSDKSIDICQEYARKDDRVILIKKENGGASSARNTGLDIAKGKFVMFVDSDDFVESKMVEALLNLQAKTLADISCCEIKRYNNETASRIEKYHLKCSVSEFGRDEIIRLLILRKIDCAPCNKLFKRNLIAGHRFVEGRTNEDYLFLFYLFLDCERVVYTNEAYYNYRITPGSVTRTFGRRSLDQLVNVIEIENYIGKYGLDYSREIHLYKVSVCISLGYCLRKYKAEKEFMEAYRYCKRIIAGNAFLILKSVYYGWRVKVMALITFL